MSHQHSAVSLKWGWKVFRPSIIHFLLLLFSKIERFFFLNCKYFLINWQFEPRMTKVKKKKKCWFCLGHSRTLIGWELFLGHPCGLGFHQPPHSASTKLEQRSVPAKSTPTGWCCHHYASQQGCDWAGNEQGPLFPFPRCLKRMPKRSIFLTADTESCFSTVFWLRGIRLHCRDLPDLSAIRTEDRENLKRRFRV